ncbi:MAG TPA: elongation factor G [Gammaproteobacteria bacterium]|nr:elongation factor G [Gammaproteobacteria bacterium]
MPYTTADIRNLALVGHAGAGKTLLTETLLLRGGAIRAAGSLVQGTTVADSDPLEREFQHSLDVAICHMDVNGCHINLIDTPGYPDLLGRARAVLPAVETVAVVIDATAGIGIGTRQMFAAAARLERDRIIVVNKIDVAGVDFAALVAQIQQAFGSECLPINLPLDGGTRVVDCFFTREGPDTPLGRVADAHRRIIEQVVEVDPAIMERYLESGEDFPPEALHGPFEQALREGHLIPICFVSAEKGTGIAELIDLIVRLMPNPCEANPPAFVKGEGAAVEPVSVEPQPDRHVVAHVFKVNIDPYVGKIGVFRIHQGTVRTGAQLYVGDARKPFKVTHLYKLQGKQTVDITAGIPGDICAVAKVDELFYDAVLHDSHDEDHYHLRPVAWPPPMLGLAIEPARRGDEQKLADALHKLAAEDPSLRIEHVPALNETVLYGHGELHLRIVLERMKRQYGVELKTRPPSIPYRETVTSPAEGHHRHKKQTGGAGQFGEVFLRIEPLPRGKGFEFVDEVVGGAIPQQFIPAVEKGVRQVLETGAIAGYPIQDVRVIVYDGKTHPVDSKEIAFVTAGRKAFLDAIAKARPIVLEPIMDISISTPAANIGAITGDLTSMRGRINDQRMGHDGVAVIQAQVPLSELGEYHHRLKSQTSGEGSFTMEFSHYEPVPPRLQQELVNAYAKRRKEESE